MLAPAALLLAAAVAAEGIDPLNRALGAASVPRTRSLCELAAVLDLPPSAFTSHAACVESARRRVDAGADWRVRRDGAYLSVRLVEASGHLDRIRAWWVRDGVRQRLPGRGIGDRRRFPLPRGWPADGALQLEASSSLLPDAPMLLMHQVRPAGSAPPPPPLAAPPADVPPPPRLRPSPPPWWLWVAGAVATGAIGLGVWQEAR